MATTRIMPLHIGKGRTESRAISAIIDYVANPQKTDHGKLITGYECDSRVADAEFMLAKRQYIAATGRVRGADDVIAYHVRQSFCPGEITPEEANRLGVEFAKRFTKGKHAFMPLLLIPSSSASNYRRAVDFPRCCSERKIDLPKYDAGSQNHRTPVNSIAVPCSRYSQGNLGRYITRRTPFCYYSFILLHSTVHLSFQICLHSSYY